MSPAEPQAPSPSRERERGLIALHALARRAGAVRSARALARLAAQAAAQAGGPDGGAVARLDADPAAGVSEAVATAGGRASALAPLTTAVARAEAAARRSGKPRRIRGASGPRRGPGAGPALAAALVVPVLSGGRAAGVIVVASRRGAGPDAAAVQRVVDQAAIVGCALEKLRLRGLARRHAEDLRFFRAVGGWVAGTLDMDRLLARISAGLARRLDVPQCCILLHDPAAHELRVVAGTRPLSGDLTHVRIPLSTSRSATVRAFKTHRPVKVPDARIDPRVSARLVRAYGQTSILAVPLVSRGEGIGAVMLGETRRRRDFSPEEIARAEAIASQAALVIDNARRHREAVEARERAERFLEIVQESSSSVDLHDALRRIARRTVAMTTAERCSVYLPDESGTRVGDIVHHGVPARFRPGVEAMRGLPFDAFPAGVAMLRSRRAVVYDDVAAEGGIPPDVAERLGVKAIVVAPMRARGEFVAVFVVGYPPHVTAVPRSEVQLIEGVAGQVALAVQNARALDQIARQRLALDVLTARMIGAQEDERRAIASELHDGVSQTLTAVKFELERVNRKLGYTDDLGRVVTNLGGAIGELRRMCMDLRPSQLDHLGLATTLGWFVKSFGERTGLAVTLDAPESLPELPPPLQINVYRIVQEALANVQRHAAAASIAVRIRTRGRRLVVSIADDGCGFDPGAVERRDAGLGGVGLLTMRERAHLLDGELRVRSTPGEGTTIEAELPLRAGAAGAGGESSAAIAPPGAGAAGVAATAGARAPAGPPAASR